MSRSVETFRGGSNSAIVTWNTASFRAANAGEATTVRPDTKNVSRSPNATSIGFADGLNSRSARPASARLAFAAAYSPICIA